MLTGLVRHASPVVAAAFPSARKCASSTANIRKHSRLLFSTSAINNSYEYGRSMSYMLLGSLAAASLYYLTGSEAGKAKADGETEEPVAVAKSPAVLTGLQKSTAYIVGDGVLTGKTDTDPMIVPHQVRQIGRPLFPTFRTNAATFPVPMPNILCGAVHVDCVGPKSEGSRHRRRRSFRD